MSRHTPDDASADLALARAFGLKGFTDTASEPKDRPTLPSSQEVNPDLAFAREFGLKGFVGSTTDNAARPLVEPAIASECNKDLALANSVGLKGFASAQITPVTSPQHMHAAELPASNNNAHQSSAVMPSTKLPIPQQDSFVQISGKSARFPEIETQIGQRIATSVNERSCYHQHLASDGSETRLFTVPPGGIAGLSALQRKPPIGLTVQPLGHKKPCDFRAVGITVAKPPHLQPDLVGVLSDFAASTDGVADSAPVDAP